MSSKLFPFVLNLFLPFSGNVCLANENNIRNNMT